ncbi:hypothetical protein F7P84_18195 [Edwardsiella anguillarum]|nr:hypothetical protein F7P84_18195 [Edwardsiella anguillarum]RFT04305.1 hypothetical protein CGL57_07040 [Edwardsiella anguillarum]
MHSVHGFACALRYFLTLAAPVLARPVPSHASALKAPHEAGRRGGESIARRMLIASSSGHDLIIAQLLAFS